MRVRAGDGRRLRALDSINKVVLVGKSSPDQMNMRQRRKRGWVRSSCRYKFASPLRDNALTMIDVAVMVGKHMATCGVTAFELRASVLHVTIMYHHLSLDWDILSRELGMSSLSRSMLVP
jgi:hypothetical protein